MSQGSVFMPPPPLPALAYRASTSTQFPQTHIKDTTFDEMWVKTDATINLEDQMKLSRETDLYNVSQQWTGNLLPSISYNVYQPWVKRYKGILLTERYGPIFARLWIDRGLKQSLGR